MTELFQETMSGIPIHAWQQFLKIFGEDQTEDIIRRKLQRISGENTIKTALSTEALDSLALRLFEILELIKDR